MALGRLHS
uniref:Uncharacterized protein n=1 Tax=Arundo donax TaxID=35708 RepID=A0A0A9A7K6_ARUDO